jgi:O-antigen ligase
MRMTLSRHALRFKTDTVASVALFCLILFAMMGSLTEGSSGSDAATMSGEGSVLRQVVYLLLFGLAVICVGLREFPRMLLKIPFSLMAIMAWCLLSVTWAIDPATSARRVFLTLIIITTTIFLVQKCRYGSALTAVRWVLALVLTVNYIAIIGWPTSSIHQPTEFDPSIVGAWHGISTQKNFAGSQCALAILFFLFDANGVSLRWRATLVFLASYFLYRTESKTSEILLCVSITIALAFSRYNRRHGPFLLAGLFAVTCLLIYISYEHQDILTTQFTDASSFTGRTQIWPLLIEYWKQHKWLGAGFGSFWNIGGPQPIAKFTDSWVSEIASGHNGFLDLLVQTGLPGLFLAVFAVLIAPLWRLLNRTDIPRPQACLVLSVIVFCVGHNFTESSLFNRDSTPQVFLMLAIGLLQSQARRAALREPQSFSYVPRPDHRA